MVVVRNGFNHEPKKAAWIDPQRKRADTAPRSIPDSGRNEALTKREKVDEILEEENQPNCLDNHWPVSFMPNKN
ncbi:unnamed protein product [Arabidopsis halleri]